ncbi:DUF6175 family protein [Parabacteroides sp. OttesenSCG-928-N08]|nr:DUF6175 family protein [Parabacteroides sp. OttesenSCG-928-N08]
MVVPSEVWCNDNGYMIEYDNQGVISKIPDYQTALQENKDLLGVITNIGILMADNGFPLQDLSATLKSIQTRSVEDALITSKATGAGLAESPVDLLRRTAKADIIMEVDWTVSKMGFDNQITYTLRGLDAYTNKQVAGAQGTGNPSYSAVISDLLKEAVSANMDNFNTQLQNHFDDLFENGREVVLDIRVFDDGSGFDLETEYDGYELMEIIDDWMAENTVQHRFSKADGTENFLIYDQVRIPLYRTNGAAMDTEYFARELRRFLSKEPYQIPSKILPRGLGRCLVILGEK